MYHTLMGHFWIFHFFCAGVLRGSCLSSPPQRAPGCKMSHAYVIWSRKICVLIYEALFLVTHTSSSSSSSSSRTDTLFLSLMVSTPSRIWISEDTASLKIRILITILYPVISKKSRIKMKNCFLIFLLATVAESFNISPQLGAQRTPTVALHESNHDGEVSRRTIVQSLMLSSLLPVALGRPQTASARLEAVNRPDLLPSEQGLNVIQTEKFLTSGQAKRLDKMMVALEKDTGYRLRVLCQNYPNTPGK